MAKTVQHPNVVIKYAVITLRQRVSICKNILQFVHIDLNKEKFSPLTTVVKKSWMYRFDRCGKLAKLMFRSPDLLITRLAFCGRLPFCEQCVSILWLGSEPVGEISSERFAKLRSNNWSLFTKQSACFVGYSRLGLFRRLISPQNCFVYDKWSCLRSFDVNILSL